MKQPPWDLLGCKALTVTKELMIILCLNYIQEVAPTKEPLAFDEVKTDEVILSVAIYHPRKVSMLITL